MSQFTGRIVGSFAVTNRPVSSGIGAVDLEALAEFYHGGGVGQADTLGRKTYSIAPGATQSVNLVSWIAASLPGGGDVELASVKALYIRNASAVTGDAVVTIGGSFSALAGAAIPMPGGGFLLMVNPSADGWPTNAATTIEIENTSMTDTATVEVAAIGVGA
jgi:hypothetical protein